MKIMSVIGRNVKILKGVALLGLILGLAGVAPAADPYVVAPVDKADQMRLLPASAWPPPEAEQGGLLLKLSYLRGLMDALQYAQVSPKATAEALNQLKGMDLNALAAAVDRYYLADPRRRDLPPAAVILRILPQQQGQVEPTPLNR
ncbi:MAG: hypothetical protein V1797_11755 [Pseudomonadota bacterium]